MVIVVAAGAAYIYGHGVKKIPAVSSQASNFQGFALQRGERVIKKQISLALVATYEKMHAKYPDSVDLKKKLAFAYFGAELYDKALPLLEEVARTDQADTEVAHEIAFIKARQHQ